MTRLRFDPWTAEYSAPYAVDPAVTIPGETVLDLELPVGDWRPLGAGPAGEFNDLVFIDGSRRMDARIQVETDDGVFRAHGGLGTTAAGAVGVRRGQPARFLPPARIGRWCFTGGGSQAAPVVLPAAGHHLGELRFEPEPVADTAPEAILQALQNRMRREEALLAAAAAAEFPGSLIVCDGPLPREADHASMIGYIKTTTIQRLPDRLLEVARQLKAGERTPIYLAGEGELRNFEWLLRLRDPAPWYYSLAGTVRIQVRAARGQTGLSDLVLATADWSCRELPAFSSQAHQDPRAPQQLLPVRALEAELRRRMGDPMLLRRRIVRDHFAA